MKNLMENWRGYIQESEDDFSPHTMYDPKSGKSERAETKERHLELADKGYTHVDPEKLRDIINKEGGAAGLDAIVDQADASEEEVKKTLDAMDDVATHKEGDLVIDDGDGVEVSEGKICDAGISYVIRTDPGGKDIKRGKDKDGDGKGDLQNWSARAAQIASKYCKDPDYGKGRGKDAKDESQELEEDCWDGYERVPGSKEGAPGSCRKKTDEAMTEAEGGLKAWEKENWTHSDGTPCGGGKGDGSSKRCKPASKWKTMSKSEKAADNAKKKKANKAGKYSVSATKKGKVTKSHTKRNESIFKNLRESLDNIEEAADYGNFPDEVLNYLQEKPNRVINGAMLAYAFGGAQQRHTRMLQMMAQQGKLEYKDGHYRLASLTEDEIEEAAKCDGPTKKASSDAKGKKWMKCVKSDSGGYKRIHWGQKGVRVTGKSGDTKRKKSFKARHGCANAKANTPKGQACKDWA